MLKGVVTFALIGMAVPGSAQDAPKPEKPRKICRTEGETGSRLQRRTCKTAAEWTDVDAGRVRDARDLQQSPALAAPR